MFVFKTSEGIFLVPYHYISENGLDIEKIYDNSLGEADRFYLLEAVQDCRGTQSIYCVLIIIGSTFYMQFGEEDEFTNDQWIEYKADSVEFVSLFFSNENGGPVLHFLYPDLSVVAIQFHQGNTIDVHKDKIDANYVITPLYSDCGNNCFTINIGSDVGNIIHKIPVKWKNPQNRYSIGDRYMTGGYEKTNPNTRLISHYTNGYLFDDGTYYCMYGCIRDEYVVKISRDPLSYLTREKKLKISTGCGEWFTVENVDNYYSSYITDVVYVISDDRLLSLNTRDLRGEGNNPEMIEILPGGASYVQLPIQSYYDTQISANKWTKSSTK